MPIFARRSLPGRYGGGCDRKARRPSGPRSQAAARLLRLCCFSLQSSRPACDLRIREKEKSMTKQRSLIRIAALAIAVSAALPAMAETLVETGRHHYIYFGDHDIYYAPETKTYFWLDHGR